MSTEESHAGIYGLGAFCLALGYFTGAGLLYAVGAVAIAVAFIHPRMKYGDDAPPRKEPGEWEGVQKTLIATVVGVAGWFALLLYNYQLCALLTIFWLGYQACREVNRD